MRLRSLVRRLHSPSPSVSTAPVQPDIDPGGVDVQSPASTPDDTEVFELGIGAAKRRAGIIDPYAYLTEPCCRSSYYSPLQHAAQLLSYLVLYNNCAERVIDTDTIQCDFGSMACELRWHCRPWNPVAHQFTLLTSKKKVYRRRTEPPVGRRERAYPIPSAAEARPICEQVLGQASLFVAEAEREFLWPGPPTSEHCPHVDHPCPLWRPWHGKRR